jgi:DNA-directed RNA polymerase subunit RPC12/RpoP
MNLVKIDPSVKIECGETPFYISELTINVISDKNAIIYASCQNLNIKQIHIKRSIKRLIARIIKPYVKNHLINDYFLSDLYFSKKHQLNNYTSLILIAKLEKYQKCPHCFAELTSSEEKIIECSNCGQNIIIEKVESLDKKRIKRCKIEKHLQ